MELKYLNNGDTWKDGLMIEFMLGNGLFLKIV